MVTTLDPTATRPTASSRASRRSSSATTRTSGSARTGRSRSRPKGKDVTLDLVVTAAPSKIQQEFFESIDPLFKAARTGERAPEPLSFREAFDRIAKSARLEEWQREPLLIPSRDLGRWERTHPLEQIRWTQQKNDNTGGHYINVVRALKWWRKENPDGKYPKGYPLEHLVGDTCPDGIGSVAEGVTRALEAIRGHLPHLRPDRPEAEPARTAGVPEHDVLQEDHARAVRDVLAAGRDGRGHGARGAER